MRRYIVISLLLSLSSCVAITSRQVIPFTVPSAPVVDTVNIAEYEKKYNVWNKNRDMDIYRQYVKNQVREILTNYGKIDILWLDYSFPSGNHGKGRDDWDSKGLLKIVRELQPGIIVDDRAQVLIDLVDGVV